MFISHLSFLKSTGKAQKFIALITKLEIRVVVAGGKKEEKYKNK